MPQTGKRMPVAKAKRIISEFVDNGYNQKKALLKSGYSEGTARARSGEVINTAFRTIARDNLEQLSGEKLGKKSILDLVGMTQDDVLAEYLYIAKQDKDLTNKLKALVPLLKELGISWEEKATLNAPTLNLTVKQNDNIRLNQAISQSVAQDSLCDVDKPSYIIDNMAQQSHEAEPTIPDPQSVIGDKKEGKSLPPNISENSVIDNPDNLSSNE